MSKKVISILLLLASVGGPATASAGWFKPKKDKAWNQYLDRVEEVASRERRIPQAAIDRTIAFLKANRAQVENRITNKSVVIINDFTQESTRDRMFVVYVYLGKVESYQVAHGIGSGEGPHVYRCSNVEGSKATPPGFHLVQNENRQSSFGSSLYMDSLEPRNSNSRERAVVFHPNKTAKERAEILRKWGFIDLSEGCAQLTREDYYKLKPRVQGGSLLYNFCPEDL
ncbi:murein L,D-transpeptidase catalytic domain-containing protein [Bdellovibrio sp. HCB209]|uniref:murein L,D-transpeptidase catalytic domain-containing protein n=1 Tax=Bdellovibrio sp. HCB209 TaxID=3394354 RepID=UPI0039B5AF15